MRTRTTLLDAVWIAGMLAIAALPAFGATPGAGAEAADKRFNDGSSEQLPAQARRLEAKVHIDTGYAYLRQGKYDEARNEAMLALSFDPKSQDAQQLQNKIEETLGMRPTGARALETLTSRMQIGRAHV